MYEARLERLFSVDDLNEGIQRLMNSFNEKIEYEKEQLRRSQPAGLAQLLECNPPPPPPSPAQHPQASTSSGASGGQPQQPEVLVCEEPEEAEEEEIDDEEVDEEDFSSGPEDDDNEDIASTDDEVDESEEHRDKRLAMPVCSEAQRAEFKRYVCRDMTLCTRGIRRIMREFDRINAMNRRIRRDRLFDFALLRRSKEHKVSQSFK